MCGPSNDNDSWTTFLILTGWALVFAGIFCVVLWFVATAPDMSLTK